MARIERLKRSTSISTCTGSDESRFVGLVFFLSVRRPQLSRGGADQTVSCYAAFFSAAANANCESALSAAFVNEARRSRARAPLSMNCGGDCWRCVSEIEADPGNAQLIEQVREERVRGLRPGWIGRAKK